MKWQQEFCLLDPTPFFIFFFSKLQVCLFEDHIPSDKEEGERQTCLMEVEEALNQDVKQPLCEE